MLGEGEVCECGWMFLQNERVIMEFIKGNEGQIFSELGLRWDLVYTLCDYCNMYAGCDVIGKTISKLPGRRLIDCICRISGCYLETRKIQCLSHKLTNNNSNSIYLHTVVSKRIGVVYSIHFGNLPFIAISKLIGFIVFL